MDRATDRHRAALGQRPATVRAIVAVVFLVCLLGAIATTGRSGAVAVPLYAIAFAAAAWVGGADSRRPGSDWS